MTAPWPAARAQPQAHLADALDELLALISAPGGAHRESPAPPRAAPACSVDVVAERFRLSGFERDLLLLCAGLELDAAFAAACRSAASGEPSFGFALATLPGAHWSALTPTAPLRYWRLITVAAHEPLSRAPLRIDERILHFIAGVSHLDERLHGLIRPGPRQIALGAGQQQVADEVAALWRDAGQRGASYPAVQLIGEAATGRASVAAAICAAHDLDLYVVEAGDLPASLVERVDLERLWVREAALSDSGLLIETRDADGPEALRAAAAFAANARCAVLVGCREPLRAEGRPLPRFDVPRPSRGEQAELWATALAEPLADPAQAQALGEQIERVVGHFDLGAEAIGAIGTVASGLSGEGSAAAARLWEACRRQSRGRLDDLAQRVETSAGWPDLVLPAEETEILQEIVANVRQRATVYDRWGFAERTSRGLGVSALFAGTSGTGKSLAAEIIAQALELDLYRIDLSQVVSKYIGETEKNLRRVFDAAEAAGAVLLFDEADALFGRRSDVKDSHDRYANLEVSYLLQRMEAYRGLAILTSNLPHALDPAFKRRLRFIVQFPFPDAAERRAIWARAFPEATPTRDLDLDRLAQVNVAGGNIRNIALGAAFLAADAGQPVSLAHVLRATRAECAKIGRTLTAGEVNGWGAP